MSKLFAFVVAFVLCSIFYAPQSAYASSNSGISVVIDGEEVIFTDAHPMIVNGRMLVPVRAVFEQMGFDVETGRIMTSQWPRAYAPVAVLRNGDTVIKMEIGGSVVVLECGTQSFSAINSLIYNNRLFVPLRIIAEAIGDAVEWDGYMRTALITTTKTEIVDMSRLEYLVSSYNATTMHIHPRMGDWGFSIFTISSVSELDELKSAACIKNSGMVCFVCHADILHMFSHDDARSTGTILYIFNRYQYDFFKEKNLVFLNISTNFGGFSHINRNGDVIFRHAKCMRHLPGLPGSMPLTKIFEISNTDMPASFRFVTEIVDNFSETCSNCFFLRYGIRVPWEEWEYHGFTS